MFRPLSVQRQDIRIRKIKIKIASYFLYG